MLVILPESANEGMIFVRIAYILTAMVRVPMIAVCLFLLYISLSLQYVLASPKALEFTVYADGTTHVFYQTDVNSQVPEFTVGLYGNNTSNLVSQDENGTLLSSKVSSNDVVVETLGASTIKVDYDTPDLVSKSGRTWTFQLDSPMSYSVLLPKNTVIVGMSTPPLNLQIIDGQSLISLPAGSAEISYVFGVVGTNQAATISIQKAHDFISTVNSEGIKTPLASAKLDSANTAFKEGRYSDAEQLATDAKSLAVQEQEKALSEKISSHDSDYTVPIVVVGGVAAAASTGFIILRKARSTKELAVPQIPKNNYIPPDKETIFRAKPELRQDDKEIIAFVSEKGGRVFESELRKKFLLPRTTMWRAVKRLEREGIVEIEKVDQQNLIKLRKLEEDRQE